MERHIFAGGNTQNGFVNYYENILDRSCGNGFYILKGGSGVGKSTFLKKIAKSVCSDRIEYFHCSSDTSSLDGLCFPDKGIAFVDGTAPHIVEPVFVKCGDNTIDLAVAIDSGKIKDRRAELNIFMIKKKAAFFTAYGYIAAIGALRRLAKAELKKNMDSKTANRIIGEMFDNIIVPQHNLLDRRRKFFAGALCDKGEYYTESYYPDCRIVTLRGKKELSALLIKRLMDMLEVSDIDFEALCSPIDCEDIYELNLGGTVITVNDKVIGRERIDIEVDGASSCDEKLYDDMSALRTSMSGYFRLAKDYHAEIEKIYTPCVDFKKVESILADTVKQLS